MRGGALLAAWICTAIPAGAQTLTANPSQVSRVFASDGSSASVSVSIGTTGGGAQVTITPATDSGGNWISVNPASGLGSAAAGLTVTIGIDPSGLPDGTYTGKVTVSAASPAASLLIPVAISVGDPGPQISSMLLNGATFPAAGIRAGATLTVLGKGIGPKIPYEGEVRDGVLTSRIAGTRVWFDNTPAPLVYAHPGEVAAVIPDDVSGKAAVQVRVETLVARSLPVSVPVQSSQTSVQLAVSSSHIGSFVRGQPTGAYTLSVQNTGTAVTSGTVSVTDVLPAGLTAVAMNGPGWTCSLATLTCTRSDALAPGGKYAPVTITIRVSADAAASVTNHATVSGGGSATATASDPTAIVPAFTDIPASDSSFIPFIDLLQQSGITKGCRDSPPMYCSTAPIPESQMAVFVIRSVMGNDNFAYTSTPYFGDVPASNLYFPWIQKMQDLGIALPCSPTQYCPDSAVTRGIMSVLIIRSRFGVSTPTDYPTTPYFTDVSASHPYFAWIQKMKQLGITSGCTPTTYCPDDPVTRGQMAVFIMRGEFNQGLQDPNTPVLVWANPASASPGQTVSVTIVGQNTNFSNGVTQVNAGAGITASDANVLNGTTMTVRLTVAAGAASGPRSITVTTGSEEATLPNGFALLSPAAK